MIEIWCPKDGKHTNCRLDNQKIYVPNKCCGITIKLLLTGSDKRCSHFSHTCRKHFYSWEAIWNNFGSNGIMFSKSEEPEEIKTQHSFGCTCIDCGLINEYAVPNMGGGKYRCFECR
jgi:hypothetical protein